LRQYFTWMNLAITIYKRSTLNIHYSFLAASSSRNVMLTP